MGCPPPRGRTRPARGPGAARHGWSHDGFGAALATVTIDVVPPPPLGWSQHEGPGVDLADGRFTASATHDEQVLAFHLTTTRDGAATTDAVVRVRVVPANSPPVVPDRDAASTAGEPARLVLGAHYGDGDALSYTWRQVEGPDVELSSISAIAPIVVPQTPGTYVFELVVADGLESATGRFTLAVEAPVTVDPEPALEPAEAAEPPGPATPHVDPPVAPSVSYTCIVWTIAIGVAIAAVAAGGLLARRR